MQQQTYRVGVNITEYRKRLVRYSSIAAFCSAIVMTILMVVCLQNQKVYYEGLLDSTVQEYNEQITQLQGDHNTVVNNMKEESQQQIDSLQATIDELTSQVEQRKASSSEVFEYARKYWYIFRDAPDNSGLTMDDIIYLDDLCKEDNLNPHLMWCIYDNESGYTAKIDNPTSTARGLGQVLRSSGKSYYENVLQIGSYSHELAYDPRINMQITEEMIARNMGSGIQNAIALYSGDSSGAYYNKLVQTAAEHGVSIADTSYQ